MVLLPVRDVAGHGLDVCPDCGGGDVGVAGGEPADDVAGGERLTQLVRALAQQLVDGPVVLHEPILHPDRVVSERTTGACRSARQQVASAETLRSGDDAGMSRVTPLILGVSMNEPDPPLAPFALPFTGPVAAFYGKNGSGKTRLLNALAHAAGAASAPEGAAGYLLHVELVPGAEPQRAAFDLAAGLHGRWCSTSPSSICGTRLRRST